MLTTTGATSAAHAWFAVLTVPGTQNFVSALDQDDFMFTT